MRVFVLTFLLLAAALAAPASGAPRSHAHAAIPALAPGDHLVVRPRQPLLVLRASPGGPPLVRVGPRARFGGPLVLGVVARRGDWLGVSSEELPNGEIGWVDAAAAAVSVGTVRYELRVELGARRLDVVDGGRVVRRIPVAVGSPDSPTPTGRFAVAEKLDGASINPVYGCCILALTARQPDPPPGWDRGQTYFVAIHVGGGIGSASSAGCLHATETELRYLMRTIPLGTPVTIER